MQYRKARGAYFTEQLMRWHSNENHRSLPWKLEKDPYKIWLSEIILQQTRAEQGLPYYLKFTQHYPTIHDLAKANDEEVFRLWQGLGYYNRCKNLLVTARYISLGLGGKFPDTHEALLQLKGIGAYTAAAIGSFAFGLPLAVVDGNVNRVLARFWGIETAIDTTEGKKLFQALADNLVDKSDSAGYNQAIMDLGATVCTPASPSCNNNCPLQPQCEAHRQDLIALLPVKSKKLVVRKRYFHYLVLTHSDRLWIRKRTGNDIWQNLYEPYLIEHAMGLTEQGIVKEHLFKGLAKRQKPRFAGQMTQRLTHQLIETRFFTLALKERPQMPENAGEWVHFEDLKKYPFPKTLVSFLEKKLYF